MIARRLINVILTAMLVLPSLYLPALSMASGVQANTSLASFASGTGKVSYQEASCPWRCTNIGGSSVAGSDAITNGVWIVTANGGDLGGTADQFHYIWQRAAGDATITMRITSEPDSSDNAKLGPMFRVSIDPDAPFYAFVNTPHYSTGVPFVIFRRSRGAPAVIIQVPSLDSSSSPPYLRIVRAGDTFTSYTLTPDGKWTPVAHSSATLRLTNHLLAGIAVSGYDKLTSVAYDNVALSSSNPPDSSAPNPSPTSSPGIITTIIGTGHSGYTGDGGSANQATLFYPGPLAVDDHNHLFIGDIGNKAVREVMPNGRVRTVIASRSDTEFGTPSGLAVYGDTLYVADSDHNTVLAISVSGRAPVRVVAGTGKAGYAGDGATAIKAQLNQPAGLATDRAGDLFIADSANHAVREIIARTGMIRTYAGGGTSPALATNGCPSTKGVETSHAPIFAPVGVAVDSQGNLFVDDDASWCILRLGRDGQVTPVVTAFDFSTHTSYPPYAVYRFPHDETLPVGVPYAIAIGPNDHLYFADVIDNVVGEVVMPGVLTIVAGNINAPKYSGDGYIATAPQVRLARPLGVAVDNANNLYIADTRNNRVRVVKSSRPVLAARRRMRSFALASNKLHTLNHTPSSALSNTIDPPVHPIPLMNIVDARHPVSAFHFGTRTMASGSPGPDPDPGPAPQLSSNALLAYCDGTPSYCPTQWRRAREIPVDGAIIQEVHTAIWMKSVTLDFGSAADATVEQGTSIDSGVTFKATDSVEVGASGSFKNTQTTESQHITIARLSLPIPTSTKHPYQAYIVKARMRYVLYQLWTRNCRPSDPGPGKNGGDCTWAPCNTVYVMLCNGVPNQRLMFADFTGTLIPAVDAHLTDYDGTKRLHAANLSNDDLRLDDHPMHPNDQWTTTVETSITNRVEVERGVSLKVNFKDPVGGEEPLDFGNASAGTAYSVANSRQSKAWNTLIVQAKPNASGCLYGLNINHQFTGVRYASILAVGDSDHNNCP